MKGESPVAQLLARWQKEATELTERYSQPALAGLTSQHIRELENALGREDNELLTLTEAGHCCGYTADHLGRLVRQGALENYGQRYAPPVKRGDLPSKGRLREVILPFSVASTRQANRAAVVNRLRSD